MSGCSAARLARLLREQEAGGSNPLTPTNKNNKLQKTLTHKAGGQQENVSVLCQLFL